MRREARARIRTHALGLMPVMMWQTLKEDIQAVFDRDPAARSTWEVAIAYPGFHAKRLWLLKRFATPGRWLGS